MPKSTNRNFFCGRSSQNNKNPYIFFSKSFSKISKRNLNKFLKKPQIWVGQLFFSDMKVEPGSIKVPSDSQFLANSPQSDALSINSDILSQPANNSTSNPVSSSTSTARQRKPNSANRTSRPGTAVGAAASGMGGVPNAGFMPNKTDQTKVHPCPFCPVTLGSSMNLKKHIQRKHSTPLHKVRLNS